MRALLIPVKDLTRAKQRLAPALSQRDRTMLAEAMFDDVCRAVAGVRGVERIVLVSSYEPALDRALSLGWEILRETAQESESASVDAASRTCAARGITTLMRLPIDVPLVEAADIESLFQRAASVAGGASGGADAGSGACAVLTPSRCGTGTNALLRTPPDLFASHFGPHSFGKHLAEAARCGARTEIVRNWRLELDIDDAADAEEFLAQAHRGRATATEAWLRRAGFRARVAEDAAASANFRSEVRAEGAARGATARTTAAAGTTVATGRTAANGAGAAAAEAASPGERW